MKINLKKKHVYFLAALIVLFIGITYAIAYGGTSPATMGHSAGEIGSGTIADTLTVSSGNVGIGTTSPGSKLEVNGAITLPQTTSGKVQAGTYYLNVNDGSGNTVLNGGNIRLKNNELESVSIVSGNVGIGTTGPQQELDIYASSAPSIRLSTASHFAEIEEYLGYPGNNGGGLLFKARNGQTGASDTVMAIQGSTNNVGIGTTSPSAKLDVNGDIHISNSASKLRWRNYANSNWVDVLQLYGSNDDIYLGFENKNIFLRTNSGNPSLTVDSSGSVGIGTTSPAAKLHVAGAVKATEFQTGDIFFNKNDKPLWRMFEDEDGLYVENLNTGKVYKIALQEVR